MLVFLKLWQTGYVLNIAGDVGWCTLLQARRGEREAKKKWVDKKPFQTTRTQQRTAITNSSSGENHAAWTQFKSHVHDTPYEDSGSALSYTFRDVDKSKFLQKESTFATAVRREADKRNEMAQQWNPKEDDDSDVEDDWGTQAISWMLAYWCSPLSDNSINHLDLYLHLRTTINKINKNYNTTILYYHIASTWMCCSFPLWNQASSTKKVGI